MQKNLYRSVTVVVDATVYVYTRLVSVPDVCDKKLEIYSCCIRSSRNWLGLYAESKIGTVLHRYSMIQETVNING